MNNWNDGYPEGREEVFAIFRDIFIAAADHWVITAVVIIALLTFSAEEVVKIRKEEGKKIAPRDMLSIAGGAAVALLAIVMITVTLVGFFTV